MIRLIVIDNNPWVGKALEHILNRQFNDSVYMGQFYTGKAALEQFSNEPPNIVVVDVSDSGLDGVDIARELKKKAPDINIVAMGAYYDSECIEKVYSIGAKAFSYKPINYRDFIQILNGFAATANYVPSYNQNDISVMDEIFKLIEKVKMNSEYAARAQAEHIFSQIKDVDCDFKQLRVRIINVAAEIVSCEKEPVRREILSAIYKKFLGEIINIENMESLKIGFTNFVISLNSIYRRNGNGYKYEIISHIEECVDAHLDEEISLEWLAEELGYSKSYLSRIFKEISGKNFRDYLIDRRMERAKYLLSSSDDTIEMISKKIGYENASSFRRIFNKKIGMSATEYRQKVHNL